MKNRRNYYRILHVQPDAPMEIIKSSYRTLMLKLKQHPDLGGESWNTKLINEAKHILTNPNKRTDYDRLLRKSQTKKSFSGQSHFQDADYAEDMKYGRQKEKNAKAVCIFCKSSKSNTLPPNMDSRCSQCRSPMNPAKKVTLEKSCQRLVNRIKKHSEITFYTDWPPKKGHRGLVRDLSPNGMQFLAHQLLHNNHIIKIRSNILHATARVVNSRKLIQIKDNGSNSYVVGVEFCTLQFQHPRGTFVSVSA